MDNLEQLIAQAEGGDKKAFAEIYRQTYKAVYFTCLGFLKNDADAADVSQEVFITVLQTLPSLKERSRFKYWLSRITVNKCKDFLKKKKPIPTEEETLTKLLTEESELLLPEDCVTNAAKRKIILDIMKETLSDVLYQTVILFYFNEIPAAEIAELMDCPIGTVLYRLSAARVKIKEGILKYEKKHGDKLYSAVLVAALSALLSTEAMAMEPPYQCETILQAASQLTTAAKAAELGGKAMLQTLKSKIIAGVLALALIGGSIAAVVFISDQLKENDNAQHTEQSDHEQDEDTEETRNKDDAEDSTKTSGGSASQKAQANEDYFIWDHDTIKGWSELGLQQTHVMIPARCTRISAMALANHPLLEYVSFENDAFVLETMCVGLFENCTALQEVILPASITELPGNIFKGCSSLESISLPESVVTIGFGSFKDCTSLKSFTVPEGVTEIKMNTFWGCTSLTDIQFNGKETIIGQFAFCDCISLKAFTIPASVVTIDSSAFKDCVNLVDLVFEEGNLQTIEAFAFDNCKSLTKVVIPEGCLTIESAFDNCDSLVEVYLPASLEDAKWSSFEIIHDWTVYVKKGSYADSIEWKEYIGITITKEYY